jgi:hypothetical protein
MQQEKRRPGFRRGPHRRRAAARATVVPIVLDEPSLLQRGAAKGNSADRALCAL